MHDEEIKRIILEVYFLFKKIIALTTSIAISLLSINGIYAQASVLNNINSEAVNASYLEKKDLNTNIYDFNNHIYAVNINNIVVNKNIAEIKSLFIIIKLFIFAKLYNIKLFGRCHTSENVPATIKDKIEIYTIDMYILFLFLNNKYTKIQNSEYIIYTKEPRIIDIIL